MIDVAIHGKSVSSCNENSSKHLSFSLFLVFNRNKFSSSLAFWNFDMRPRENCALLICNFLGAYCPPARVLEHGLHLGYFLLVKAVQKRQIIIVDRFLRLLLNRWLSLGRSQGLIGGHYGLWNCFSFPSECLLLLFLSAFPHLARIVVGLFRDGSRLLITLAHDMRQGFVLLGE